MRRFYTALKKARLAWYLAPEPVLIVAALIVQLLGLVHLYLIPNL